MINKLEEVVEISESCLCNIMRNIIEQKDHESIGDLIGKRENSHYILINAYPWQKAETDNESVVYSDFEARMRVINTDIDLREELRHFIVGQYHSHIYYAKEKRKVGLSDIDLEFFAIQRKWLKIPELLEIVASVKIKDYKNKPENKISFKNYKNKIRVIWKNNTRGYDVILGAYRINKRKEKNPEELPIRKIK